MWSVTLTLLWLSGYNTLSLNMPSGFHRLNYGTVSAVWSCLLVRRRFSPGSTSQTDWRHHYYYWANRRICLWRALEKSLSSQCGYVRNVLEENAAAAPLKFLSCAAQLIWGSILSRLQMMGLTFSPRCDWLNAPPICAYLLASLDEMWRRFLGIRLFWRREPLVVRRCWSVSFYKCVHPYDRAILFAYEESRAQLSRNASSWGIDFENLERQGLLKIICAYPESWIETICKLLSQILQNLSRQELQLIHFQRWRRA